MNKVEKDIIKKDLLNIRFDKMLRPLTTNFSIEISFVLMIVVWNFYISQKSKGDPLILLDAIISLNRIMDVEKETLETIPNVWEGMTKLKQIMNQKIDDSMYSLLFQNPILLI